MKKAIVSWNNQQLYSLKRDLLFFKKLIYEPNFHDAKLSMFRKGVDYLEDSDKESYNDSGVLNLDLEITATVEFLKKKDILEEFHVTNFMDKIPQLINSESPNLEVLKAAWYQSKMSRRLLEEDKLVNKYKNPAEKFLNIYAEFEEINKHANVLARYFLFQEKIPDDQYSLNEILDFRNDSDNRRRYLGLTRWMKKMISSNYSKQEIEEEIEYLTLEFENRMKLEGIKYKLTNLEVIFSLPLEIIENIIKLNWSKIPKSLFSIKKNKVNALIGETKAPGKELAYLTSVQSKFNKN